MADLLVLAPAGTQSLPALGLLSHQVTPRPLSTGALDGAADFDAVVVDASEQLAQARAVCLELRQMRRRAPVLLIVTEGGLPAITREWGSSDMILAGAGPAEIDARLRLLTTPGGPCDPAHPAALAGNDAAGGLDALRAAGLVVDPVSYSARLHGQPLDLTFKEFELLRYLMSNPGQVFTRSQLLSEVWGYDYFGGTRTVDVHIRRLRAKLGMDHESMIGTVRNVGYRFEAPRRAAGDTSPRP